MKKKKKNDFKILTKIIPPLFASNSLLKLKLAFSSPSFFFSFATAMTYTSKKSGCSCFHLPPFQSSQQLDLPSGEVHRHLHRLLPPGRRRRFRLVVVVQDDSVGHRRRQLRAVLEADDLGDDARAAEELELGLLGDVVDLFFFCFFGFFLGRKKRLRKKSLSFFFLFSLGSDRLSSSKPLSLSLLSLHHSSPLTLMGLVTFTRAPTSTPSWISLPGPKARTVSERAREAAGAERRGADDDERDADRAMHRRDAAEAVTVCIFRLGGPFLLREQKEERAGCSRAERKAEKGGHEKKRRASNRR